MIYFCTFALVLKRTTARTGCTSAKSELSALGLHSPCQCHLKGKTSRADGGQARSQSAHSAERLGTLCGKARQAQPSGSAEGEKRLEARMVGTEVENVRNTNL